MCMSEALIDKALENLGISNAPDARLETNMALREETVRSLLTGGMAPQVATAVKGLLSDNDKSIFTTKRLDQDKKANEDTNALLGDLYLKLVTERGRDLELDITPKAPVDPAMRELSVDASEFTILPDELITGNDTEDSIL